MAQAHEYQIIKRWEMISIAAGAVLMLGGFFIFGAQPQSFIPAVLIIVPIALFVLRSTVGFLPPDWREDEPDPLEDRQ